MAKKYTAQKDIKFSAPPNQASDNTFLKKVLQNNFAVSAVFAALIFIAYSWGFNNQFLEWDDNTYVFRNPDIINLNWGNLLRSMYAGNYHPLTMLSLGLNALVFGKTAASFIVVNVVFHAINTYLVYVFINKINAENKILSFLVALFWGLHPMHTESVIWIAERKDVLYGFFFLLSCNYYIDSQQQKSTQKYWLSFIFFILSCLSKGMAVTLPLVLMLIDFWFNKKINFSNKVIFLIVSLFFGVLAINIQGGGDFYGLIRVTKEFTAIGNTWSFFQKVIIAGYGIATYIAKCVVPIHLHNFYPYPFKSEIYQIQYIVPTIFSVLVIIGWLISYKKNQVIFFGFGFFLATIIIVLQIISVGSAIVSERYTYLPYIGLIFLFTKSFEYFKKEQLLPKVGLVIVVLFTFLTARYTQQWKNTKTIWENSYQYEADSPLIASYLAGHYGVENQSEKVYELCKKFVDMNVDEPRIYELYANTLAERKELDEAIKQYNQAIKYSSQRNASSPNLVSIYNNMAKAFVLKKDYPNALISYQKAMKLDTISSVPLAEIATIKILTGKPNEAVNELNTVIQRLSLNPTNDSLGKQKLYKYYESRGTAYSTLKNYEKAILDFDKSISLNQENASAFYNRGLVKDLLKQPKDAVIADFTNAININNLYAEAYYDRGIIYLEKGNQPQACQDFKQALSLNHPFASQVVGQYCK